MSEVPQFGWIQIFLGIGALELIFLQTTKSTTYKAGDIFGIHNRINDHDPSWIDFQTRELNNGRLAMFAILGEITHSYITGKGALEQIGFSL